VASTRWPPAARTFAVRTRYSRMPKGDWSELAQKGSAHLIIAAIAGVPSEPAYQPTARRIQLVLARLFTRLVRGRFAVIIERSRGHVEILCSFEDAADADAVARLVGASRVNSHTGWASQRAFLVDGEMERRLSEAAGPPLPRRRQR
jgi:hypothetical protein